MDDSSIINKAYLLTGGNMGDRTRTLTTAREQIARHCGEVTACSSLYETAAWGKEDQPAFLNQALEIATPLAAEQLLKCILRVEKKLGRIRQEKYGPRIIDIDILFFNNDIINYPQLKLPHPQVQHRRFALTPLAEIAPNLVHPVLKKTIRELITICPDKLEVKKFTGQ